MPEILSKVKKLKGRSLAELRVRGAQTLAAYAETRGWSSQVRVPSDEALLAMLDAAPAPASTSQPSSAPSSASTPVKHRPGFSSAESLLEHFRMRRSPAFFASFTDGEATRAELLSRFTPEERARTIEHAGEICEGRFRLLGLDALSFGQPPDWHLEPVSGRRAPLRHWSRINYLDASVAGDKKITWELNRQQYFMTLGRAYRLTGDERFAEVFAAHLGSWMDANPPKLGINWASSLEVALRSIAWLWALYFFKDSPRLTPELFLRTLKFLHLHARHLETYLSTYFSPNTHLTGEALGLFYMGTLLPEFRDAARWRSTGARILLAQLERHVKPDGVYFEQSTYYQRYTADFYTHFYLLARADEARSYVEGSLGYVETKLKALLDHLMHITRPDGTTPFFGDDDGGRLVMLDERRCEDFRAVLSTGAALFGRGDYKYVAGERVAEETLWLVGAEGLRAFDALAAHPPAQGSRAFTDGGYYVMRDGWTSADNYLLIDCGAHGADNCGHAHADALSFDLAARGRTLLVDPGTYTYTGSIEQRNAFRDSLAHNTLSIDGESSSAPAGAFTWQHVAVARTRRFTTHERFDFFEGEHDGYSRLPDPAVHARSVLFIKRDYWILRDRVETDGAHEYEWRFHFAAGAEPEVGGTNEAVSARSAGDAGLPGLEILLAAKGARSGVEQGWVSRAYAERTAAPVASFCVAASGAQDFVSFMFPRAGRERDAKELAAQVRAVEAVGGRAFEIDASDDARDFLLLSGGVGGVETARFASDFAWAWARVALGGGESGELEELVLVDGTRFASDGRELFGAGKRAGYVVARRAGDEWMVETDADEGLSFNAPGASGRVVLNGEPCVLNVEAN